MDIEAVNIIIIALRHRQEAAICEYHNAHRGSLIHSYSSGAVFAYGQAISIIEERLRLEQQRAQ